MDWEMIPAVIVPTVIFMIPIIAILTKHQQKMAELMRGNQQQTNSGELEQIRRELAELRQIVHHQTLMLDDYSQLNKRLASAPPQVPTEQAQVRE